MKSLALNNIEDMSLASGSMLSPGSSVKNLLQSDDFDPEPINPNEFNNTDLHTTNFKKPEKQSLSAFEHAIIG